MKLTKLIFSDFVFYSLIGIFGIMVLVGSVGALKNQTSDLEDRVNQITEPNFTDVVSQPIKSVVYIKCPRWQGSGFVISKHIIVTAGHVVEGVEDFEITTYNGEKLYATRAVSDKEHDIGFIWVDCELPDWMVAELGSIKDCKLGQDIFAIGSPYGDVNFNSVTKGIVSGLNRKFDFVDRQGNEYGWQISFTTDTAGHPGSSGCPVFSLDGKVRGVLVGGYSPVLVICMPVDIFIEDIEEIRLMFLMDKYQFEKKPEYTDQYYNYEDDNEYYKCLKN